MIVEHMFVTTLEWKDAIAALVTPLEALGFRWERQCASCGYDLYGTLKEGRNTCSECGKAAPLLFRYGKAKAARAKVVSDHPTTLQIDFDRGRVIVAAAMTFRGKGKVIHEMLLTELVMSLERRLAHGIPAPEAFAPWRSMSARLDAEARRKRRTVLTVLFIIVAALIALILLAAFNSGRRRY